MFISLVFDVIFLFRSFFRARILRACFFSDLLALASLLTFPTGRWSMLWPSLLFSSGSAASGSLEPSIGEQLVAATFCEHECFPCSECGPNGPFRTGGLLDLPVRTDTVSGVSGVLGGVPGPYLPVRCDRCGLPLGDCRCIPGLDY